MKEAQDGEIANANCAYIAPGGRQMKLEPGPLGEIVIRITDDAPENHCRPAVDYLFRSAALHFPGRSIAAILTGMGSDGTIGLRMLKRGGCVSIAQDEASSVVFGMPKEAIQAGLVDHTAPLDMIASAIVRSLRGTGAGSNCTRCARYQGALTDSAPSRSVIREADAPAHVHPYVNYADTVE